MNEFEVIRRFFSSVGSLPEQTLGVGDDCALLKVPAGQQLAFSLDTQVADVHFPADAPADFIARRALRCALSDLAAMGAVPHSFTLALTLPEVDERWLNDFSCGLKKDAEYFQCALLGGDTTRGALTISIQVQGILPENRALLRSAAQPGDLIFVSGTLGDASAAVSLLDPSNSCDAGDSKHLFDRYFFPVPRLQLGVELSGFAHACIDISDGFLADLEHVCRSSGVGAKVNIDRIPLSLPLQHYANEKALELALTGGDDYELCFTVDSENQQQIIILASSLDIKLTQVGEIVAGSDVVCFRETGDIFEADNTGFQHF